MLLCRYLCVCVNVCLPRYIYIFQILIIKNIVFDYRCLILWFVVVALFSIIKI